MQYIDRFKIIFNNSLARDWENSTAATDTAPPTPAGLVLDYKTLVACPAPSHKNSKASLLI